MVQSFEETQGFLFGFASQGVVYVRVMDANLAEIKSVLFSDDPRYKEANMKVRICFKFRIGGFTARASFRMVFTALQSVGWVVIPLRIWHSNELATAGMPLSRLTRKMKTYVTKALQSCGVDLVTDSKVKIHGEFLGGDVAWFVGRNFYGLFFSRINLDT